MKTIKLSKRATQALENTDSKSGALRALIIFAAQNPGFEWGNYATGDWKRSVEAYRADSRPVTRDWRKICELLWRTRDVIDEDVVQAARQCYSGRLSLVPLQDGNWQVEYCTGQYFPTEYRRAARLVLEQAIELADIRTKETLKV